MKIKMYARIPPETMVSRGKAAGLTDAAADYFRHYGEVELVLEVDETSGAVLFATTEEAAERSAVMETMLRDLATMRLATQADISSMRRRAVNILLLGTNDD